MISAKCKIRYPHHGTSKLTPKPAPAMILPMETTITFEFMYKAANVTISSS